MSKTELKRLLIKRIQSSDDEKFLYALRVLTEEKVLPVSEAVRKKLNKSLRDLDEGRVHENDGVLDDLDKWLAKK